MAQSRVAVLLGFVVVVAGCGEVTSEPGSATRPALAQAPLPSCSENVSLGGWKRQWNCGASITITGPAAWQADIQSAINAWNEAIHTDLLVSQMPRLSWAASGGIVQIQVTGTGPLWCGDTFDPPTQINMNTDDATFCPNFSSDFLTVLIHEFAHLLGYSKALEGSGPQTNCAIHLPTAGGICQHEVEYLYAGYGYRPTPTSSFWSNRIVTGVTVSPTSVSIPVGQTQALQASGLQFHRQFPPFSEPLGGVALSWASDKPTKAVLTSESGTTTTVVGADTTTTVVHARVSGLSSGYEPGTVFNVLGQQIPVTISPGPPPPPPGSGFRVTDIVGIVPPVYDAGTYPLTATVVDPPPGPVQIRWKVAYSNAVLDTVYTAFGPNSYDLVVPAGSYSIRVTAWPAVGYTAGAAGIRDFTVCTGGGGGGGRGNLAAAVPGEETNAVQGC